MRARRLVLALACHGVIALACAGPIAHAEHLQPLALALSLEPSHGEVWAREATVGGEASTALVRCRVFANASEVGAQIAGARWRARVPIASGENTIAATCQDSAGREHRSLPVQLRGMLREPRRSTRTSVGAAARDAVVYGVVPPLFGSPPLRGVIDALPELADLGVDVLWLSPVFANAPRDYGYAVTDYLQVRPDFGSVADLAELVERAHERGVRVVLDFVPNHTSARHPYFEEAKALGRTSRYWSFYERNGEGEATFYFDWNHLPNLDYANDEVARWMVENGRRWIEDIGIDGYRIDAAWGVQRRQPAFYDRFRSELRAVDPRALLFAEASARDPFWRASGLDGAYDWTDEVGEWAWKDVFSSIDGIADRLDAAVRASPPETLRFLENNDTGERFVTRHGPGLTRVASAALLTLPGIPLLFTGQEHGAEYEPYMRGHPLERDDVHDLRRHYRAFIGLRHAIPALRSDTYVRLELGTRDDRVLAFRRGDDTVVLLRFDGSASRARVGLTGTWHDALTGETFRADAGGLSVDLPAWSARVLRAN